ncbi:hypothetical protein NL676_000486 [Syzygium grande]|nr:hypothetical protein NL676_000486 [Syzygium grande]
MKTQRLFAPSRTHNRNQSPPSRHLLHLLLLLLLLSSLAAAAALRLLLRPPPPPLLPALPGRAPSPSRRIGIWTAAPRAGRAGGSRLLERALLACMNLSG